MLEVISKNKIEIVGIHSEEDRVRGFTAIPHGTRINHRRRFYAPRPESQGLRKAADRPLTFRSVPRRIWPPWWLMLDCVMLVVLVSFDDDPIARHRLKCPRHAPVW